MATINPVIDLLTGCESDRVALRGVRLEATLVGLTLKATLEQTFVNLESKAIEAIYTFPLPETAAVCGFEVLSGDHVLTAQVEETDEAVRRYDDALADGHGAFLLEQDRPDVFSARVGNLRPGQAAKIRISYVAPVERIDRGLRLRFPTTIAPRYVSAAGSDDLLQTAIDADALNPPHVLAVPYGLEMQVRVQLGAAVREISSPTHSIQVQRPDANREDWMVSFAGKLAQMDRDLVLQIDLVREASPEVQAARGPDDAHYLAVTFVPEFDDGALAEHRASETVFLLDCSGSMAGESIHQATAALELCLRSLSSGDAFNVCRFGSRYELLSSEPLTYSETTLNQALTFIRDRADLGGTEIYEPLSKLLSVKPAVGEVRNVVILTDGQVNNEPAVIELARKWRGTNRVFTFGIGAAASGYLVRNLARATGGAAEFISGDERIEDKVLRTFSRIESPMVTGVSVDWDGAEIQTPAEIPPLFDGDLLRIFARAPGRLPKVVTLKCRTTAGPQSWSLTVPQMADRDGVIALAWARSMVQSLEDAVGPITTRPAKREPSCERRLVALSKQFGILSSRTAFVAVEHRNLEERIAGMPELRRIPVQLAHGWGGAACSVVACLMEDADAAPPAAAGSEGGRLLRKSRSGSAVGGMARRILGSIKSFPDQSIAKRVSRQETADPLFRLLALQSAEGWFAAGYREILTDAGIDIESLEKRVAPVCTAASLACEIVSKDRAFATLIVLYALHRTFADRKGLWRRAEAKAKRWLVQFASLESDKIDELLAAIGELPV